MSVSQAILISTQQQKRTAMQKKLIIILTLTLISISIHASPTKLAFDSASYDVEEEDLDDFGKLIDFADFESKNDNDKAKVNTSGFKKKKTANKGLQGKYNVKDLKKFYKLAGAHDQRDFNDDDIYGEKEALAAAALGLSVNQRNKFRKGSKTRGFHRVHHKDEYKKDKEFYEDSEKSGDVKRFGGGVIGFIDDAGVKYHKGHHHDDKQKGIYGKQGYLGEGSFDKEYKGYIDTSGFDGSFNN